MADQWYYTHSGQQAGPVSSQQLRQAAVAGQLLPSDLIWKQGMAAWALAGKVKGLFPSPATKASPSLPPVAVEAAQPVCQPLAAIPLSEPLIQAMACMYCRNCGEPLDGGAVACMSCGLAPRNGNRFCRNCGAETNPAAVICMKCGVPLDQASSYAVQAAKSGSVTVWPQFFESAITTPGHPGYWKAKPLYWMAWVVGIVTIPFVVGFAINGFLLVAAITSRGDWRNSEVVAAIRQNKK